MAAAQVSPEVFLQMGREVLARQPFSVLLGTELTALSPGRVEMQLALKDEHRQQDGFAHGGILSYLADNALTYAGGTAMQVPVLMAEFKINCVRPAVGEKLIVRAQAEHVGKTQSVARCQVFAVSGGVEKLCALGQGTIVKMGESPAS
jgi:uncharacterized protein (TIGR00369 family)